MAEATTRGEFRQDRLESVDLLRGVVMIIMALDHVRDYFSNRLYMDPVDLATTTPGIFLTRWITHYCAPTFIFLAGTGAFLSTTRGKTTKQLAWFLVTRGLWLVLLEVTVIRASWMFNFDVYHHGAGVFWAIGWSMIVLAGLVFLPTWAIATFGVAMIASHNLLDPLTAEDVRLPEWLWIILHQPGEAPLVRDVWLGIPPGPVLGDGLAGANSYDLTFGTGYCLVPWMGVMSAGYGLGPVLLEPSVLRRLRLTSLGALLIMLFICLRLRNGYGDPRPWVEQPSPLFTFFSFLNCTKYPPSLLFLLMTLGPAILMLGLLDGVRGSLVRPFVIFGRVPLFYYLLHIPLIHGSAVLCDYLRFGWSPQALDGPWAVRPGEVPATYGVSLPMVYLIWMAVVLLLYPACHWFAGVKARHRAVWLSYL